MTRPVYVLAMASRTPIGLMAETSAAAAHAGISRIAEQPHLLDRRGRVVLAACDAKLDPEVRGLPRMLAMAEWALRHACERATASARWEPAVPLLLGVPEVRPGFVERDAHSIATHLARTLRGALARIDVRIAGQGHAGALRAVADAFAMIGIGRTELCVVGGVDSFIDPPILSWLDRHDRLAGEGRPGTVFPGEAAAFLVLGSKPAAQRLGLAPLAEIVGAGLATEPRRLGGDQEVLGEGLTEAIVAAMAHGGGPVDAVYGDLDGQRYRSEEWGFAQLRAHAAFRASQPCHTFMGCWGDCGAAVGALHCIQAVHLWQRGRARGNRAMVWGSSEGGLRAAIVLQAMPRG